MISFDFTFHSSDPLHWLMLVLLGVFPLLVLGILWRSTSLSPRRKVRRGGMNLFFWLVLVAYTVQPVWQTRMDSKHALIAGNDVPAAAAARWQDSLGLTERFDSPEFLKNQGRTSFDSVTLLGQEFPNRLLAQLSAKAVAWQPVYPQDHLRALGWAGLLRQGEQQNITGQIESSQKQWIKVRYAGKTLDSTLLSPGLQSFALRFPAFSEGRTSVELALDEEVLTTLRFFARPRPVLSYQFILDSPDFESRTLAEWLGRAGNRVTVTTAVSKGIRQSTLLNEGVGKTALPDVLITAPANATDAAVKKTLAAGKSVLFINLTQPEANLATINRALGTGFSVRRTTNEATVALTPTLSALPYAFRDVLPQLPAPRYPVAVWNKTGKVGVSLLSGTFPLKLSGDSATYANVWTTVLAHVQPPLPTTFSAAAPLFKGLSGALQVNSASDVPARLRVGTDTVALAPSPLNEHSADVDYLFGNSGWVALGDSMEVFVEDSTVSLYPARRLGEYLRAQRGTRVSTAAPGTTPQRERRIPAWGWLALVVLSCTALWVEPKL